MMKFGIINPKKKDKDKVRDQISCNVSHILSLMLSDPLEEKPTGPALFKKYQNRANFFRLYIRHASIGALIVTNRYQW